MKRSRKRQLMKAHLMVIRSRKVNPFAEQAFAQAVEAINKAARECAEAIGEAIILAADSLRKWVESIDLHAITENWRKIMNER